jgi:hypothetical protein
LKIGVALSKIGNPQSKIRRGRGGTMEPIQPGTLVRDADGYYAIVLRAYANGALELFIGSGVTTLAGQHTVTPLGLRVGDPADPPASFREILSPRVVP